jgi:outer membrane protein assembly factor BamB
MRWNFLWFVCVVLVLPGSSWAADWPGWRGPTGDGIAPDKKLPVKWSSTENVRWKLDLPGPGDSSPIVWGNRIFITQSLDAKGTQRALFCIDRAKGAILWKKVTDFADKEPIQYHPFCSATPVTDGRRVVACFGSAGLVCYDFEGQELWRKDLGKLHHIWGNASSPIMHGDLVIMWCGPGERQFLAAFDKKSGGKVWQHDEKGTSPKDFAGSWSTPIVVRVGNHEELILCVPEKVKAFDPKTGTELWSCAGMGKLSYVTPVCSPDGIVVAFSGFYGPALAVKAGGHGDVTKTHRLWLQTQKNPQRIGSPILLGDKVYLLSEPGLAQCFDLKTGEDLWKKERLGGTTWSSMVMGGGNIYVANDAGEINVIAAEPVFRQLACNVLDKNDKIQASPAISDGEIFIRSHKALYCIGASKTP